MSVVQDRSAAIEALHRMTSRLADSSLTAAEASLLRPQIHRLLDEVDPARGIQTSQAVDPHARA